MIRNIRSQKSLISFLLLSVLVGLALCQSLPGRAAEASNTNIIAVGPGESGEQRTGQQQVWHDSTGQADLQQAFDAYAEGRFVVLHSAGSTGLKRGSYWSRFVLENRSPDPLSLHLEYVDHQLMRLQAHARTLGSGHVFSALADLKFDAAFDERPVFHNRFVVPVMLQGNEQMEFLVRMDSGEAGFTFPSMRIWTPKQLSRAHTRETAVLSFLFGGIALIAVFSLIAGITVRERSFFAYSIYGFSKIVAWGTILGFTHQYLVTSGFHWSYMSMAGGLGILCGAIFDRLFLETRKFTPRLDYILILMIANALVLILSALFQVKPVALISITLALLLYPAVVGVALVRWRQGSSEAAVFAVGWTVLLSGLFVQALRDLGYVEHNLINYYLPPLSSFLEMITVMAALGLKLRRLRLQSKAQEYEYRAQLEQSKEELEALVQARTEELEKAKLRAEMEARTDPLTGIRNRRSFIADADLCIKRARRKSEPFSLLMFDIDHFKSINDKHGHGVGDTALCRFCVTIQEKIRETDVFGRLGGEEFALLITEDRANAVHTAERLRDNIAGISLQTPGGELKFTSSIGIAHSAGDSDNDSIETLLRRADRALYRAKAQGRDMVVEYADTAVEEPGPLQPLPV